MAQSIRRRVTGEMFSHPGAKALFVCTCAGLAIATPFAHAAPATLAIDTAHSSIDVHVKVTVDSFTAHLTQYQATITVDPGSHTVQAGSVTFQWADLKTGKPARDAEMNRWQDSAAYPTGQFTVASVTPTADPGVARVIGTLQLHGQTRQLAFPVTLRQDGAIETVEGETPVDVRDFGLPIIRKFGLLKVDPVVRVHFHLQGALPSAG